MTAVTRASPGRHRPATGHAVSPLGPPNLSTLQLTRLAEVRAANQKTYTAGPSSQSDQSCSCSWLPASELLVSIIRFGFEDSLRQLYKEGMEKSPHNYMTYWLLVTFFFIIFSLNKSNNLFQNLSIYKESTAYRRH